MGRALTLALALASIGWAQTQERVETTDGRVLILHGDGTYEEVGQAQPESGDYQRMGIGDLKLDIREMYGAQVEFRTEVVSFGEVITLGDPSQRFGDSSPIFATPGRLAREDRHFLIERCANGCVVTVRGEIGRVFMEPGVILHTLEH
ncbi:hypothetical protein J2T57_001442 [Natronocella acetinitrilica]|uniref:Uncharacterized protein n=1 Tax=Natronocella acetinitrilica TaxID=414046 RepID=A0AAE3G270_9GAMM|nr:hypothetical protein [Natronocella acetinitrilica]MCP1674340.1 hypothetical protein [Natronocella acetinitrilica]